MDATRESKSLDLLLQSKVKEFFEVVWQKSCALFRLADGINVDNISSAALCYSPPTEAGDHNPLQYLIASRISVTQHLLDHGVNGSDINSASTIEPPLIFQNQTILPTHQQEQRYDDNLWAALLDGCSIVMNHADRVSPWIASVCQDLQISLPHAYANVYITPPYQQAVEAHADDRDVFIVQLCGSKQWTVYANVPIPLPYSNEQVGKNVEVPEEVLKGPVLIQKVLTPGDVLYLPRGYVHRATSGPQVSSHVTVALATHDWTMAGLMECAGRHTWRNQLDLRMAMPRNIGRHPLTEEERQDLSDQVEVAVQLLRNELTVEAIETAMRQKYEQHNHRVESERAALIQRPVMGVPTSSNDHFIGPKAASRISLASRLRLSSDKEKASVQKAYTTTQVGLHVQEETFEEAMKLITILKGGCSLPLQEIETNLCPITVLAVAKRCVSLGALAIDH